MGHSQSFSSKPNLCLDASLPRGGTEEGAVFLCGPGPLLQAAGGSGPCGAAEFACQPPEHLVTSRASFHHLHGRGISASLGEGRARPAGNQVLLSPFHIAVKSRSRETSNLTAVSSFSATRHVVIFCGDFPECISSPEALSSSLANVCPDCLQPAAWVQDSR